MIYNPVTKRFQVEELISVWERYLLKIADERQPEPAPPVPVYISDPRLNTKEF